MTGVRSPDEAATLAAIDAANADDPERVVLDGEEMSLQVALGRRATEWIDRLDPQATPAQRIAARAHHLRRWVVPRTDYPEGRAGYLRWRRDAKDRHAAEVAEILTADDWDDGVVAAVQRLIRKQGLGSDPVVQVQEDAVCLAFLEVQLDESALKMGDEKTVEVLRRTARKMSPAGLEAAGTLTYSASGRALLAEALGAPDVVDGEG